MFGKFKYTVTKGKEREIVEEGVIPREEDFIFGDCTGWPRLYQELDQRQERSGKLVEAIGTRDFKCMIRIGGSFTTVGARLWEPRRTNFGLTMSSRLATNRIYFGINSNGCVDKRGNIWKEQLIVNGTINGDGAEVDLYYDPEDTD